MFRILQPVWAFFGGAIHTRDYHHATVARRRELDGGEPEVFEEDVRRYQLTEADLQRLHRRHSTRFYFLSSCALFALSFGATTAYLTFGPALALLAVLLGLLFLAAGAGSSLRAWQIRERRLGSFGEWASGPRTWFPPLF